MWQRVKTFSQMILPFEPLGSLGYSKIYIHEISHIIENFHMNIEKPFLFSITKTYAFVNWVTFLFIFFECRVSSGFYSNQKIYFHLLQFALKNIGNDWKLIIIDIFRQKWVHKENSCYFIKVSENISDSNHMI